MAGKVVVLGSVNVDLLVSTPRLPAPGETVSGISLTRQLGGKGANQAVGAARAGAPCILLAAVGQDGDGANMVAALNGYGVDTGRIRTTASTTGCAVVATSPQDNQIIHIAGANSDVDTTLAAEADLGPEDVCVAQMETPIPATAALFQHARAAGACTILNAAPASTAALSLLSLCDLLIVNESELALLAGSRAELMFDDENLLLSRHLLGLQPDQSLLVTLGADGLAIVEEDAIQRIAGRRATVVDTTGAGDCFCGYLAAGLARGDPTDQAAIEANAAAAIAVQSFGAASSIPNRATVLQSLGSSPAPAC
ncbi:ribokinase [Sphingobium sp. OAS761]|uniref:ribokinase n=1 Tax=Sphingobium sp. OAS761 TaxID=2817901 RepID=UPI00209FE1B1|nr:ribokinase [Sphingobium sp. OAS761]MCP1469291.1 ribokinase [Sphingobium sp. OAS761]